MVKLVALVGHRHRVDDLAEGSRAGLYVDHRECVWPHCHCTASLFEEVHPAAACSGKRRSRSSLASAGHRRNQTTNRTRWKQQSDKHDAAANVSRTTTNTLTWRTSGERGAEQ